MGYRSKFTLSITMGMLAFIVFSTAWALDLSPSNSPPRAIQEDFGEGVSDGLPTTGDYNCVGVGDINKDGNMDIIIGAEENYGTLGTTGLYAYFGNGQGNWTEHIITSTGSYAGIEVKDTDNDGYNEVFAGCQENTNGIEAWEWDGSQFQSSGISSPINSGNVNYFRIRNISGSSALDIAVARNGGIRYYQGTGSSPITWTQYSTGLRTNGLCTSMDVNDLNNDGYMDMVVGQYGDGLFAYTQNTGSTSWNDISSSLPTVERSGRILGVVTGDVNNDGNVDIIYGRYSNPFGLYLLLGNGGGASGNDHRWTYANSSWQSRPTSGFYQMHLEDIDKDGDLDLLAATENSGLHLYLGNGSEDPGTDFGWTEVTGKGLPTDMKFYGCGYIDFDSDGDLDIAGCTWGDGAMVYQNNDSHPAEPISRAGRDMTVFLGEEVALDGTNSSDAQDCPGGDSLGDILTYDWNITSQPDGSSLTDLDLSPSDSSPRPIFTPTHPGNYSFSLMVRDTENNYAREEDSIRISVILINTAPVADAGADRSVFTEELVTLNGSLSYDNEDTIQQLKFSWYANNSNPAPVSFDDPSLISPSFTTPDIPGTYSFSLVVTDSLNLSSGPDMVNVTVELRPNVDPVADAGIDLEGISNSTIVLNGTGSEDEDGEIITWIWNCTSHLGIDLVDSNSSTPEFTPNRSGVYEFSLGVIDDRGGVSEPDTVLVTVNPDNYPPAANAGKNQTVNVNSTVILNGTLSSDPEGNITLWDWNSTSNPDIQLSDHNTSMPSFFADRIGEYHFRLRVQDDRGMWSLWDHVKVTVFEEDVNITEPIENAPPTLTIITPNDGAVLNGTLNITWSARDPDGDPLTIKIELISLPGSSSVTIYDGPDITPGMIALDTEQFDNGTYEIRIIVDDGIDTAIGHVYSIEIRNEPIVIPDDDDDDPSITDDDDDIDPDDDDIDDDDDGIGIQMILGIMVLVILVILLLFAFARWLYERRDDEDFEE